VENQQPSNQLFQDLVPMLSVLTSFMSGTHTSFKSLSDLAKNLYKNSNQNKAVAIFCCQAATWGPDVFYSCYRVKNHKSDNISTTTEARG
jgi:hypothetical protein